LEVPITTGQEAMDLVKALLDIEYGRNWAIWAELNEEGKLEEGSRARYGEKIFEQGGVLDDWVYVCDGQQIADWLTEWLGCSPNSMDAPALDPFWIDEYLEQAQQAIDQKHLDQVQQAIA
jgi:hypothetical protein